MMTTPNPVRWIPEGYHTVTPFVIVKGAAQFIDFMIKAFGAEEMFPPVTSEDGSIGHAEVRIGDSVVMLFDSKPDWQQTPAFLRLYVEDCDAVYQQALNAGGTAVTRPTTLPWGDRTARVSDPFGNLWWIMTRLEEVSEEEMARRSNEPKYIEAMAYVESAEFVRPADRG
jgi:PhnB protein